ncbi:unnamed protein product [Cyclocybe aegerita]|uniref:Uncharacterized protein n=1 Tax=Cyclocybe aegerita TaxID=1973307 RepID=A0A8S0WK08_CYCAE|nr:unnamed protein product [Cyclocybe aegerita]
MPKPHVPLGRRGPRIYYFLPNLALLFCVNQDAPSFGKTATMLHHATYAEHQDNTVLVEVPPVGTAIQVGANKLMALIERERALAVQAMQGNLYDLKLYLDDHRRNAQARQATDNAKLAESQRRYTELENRFIELQNVKWADDTTIHGLRRRVSSLEQECHNLRSELLKSKPPGDESTQTTSTSDTFLASYGITPVGGKALYFGNNWLSLWNEIGRGIYQEMGPSEALMPLDLAALLHTATGQVRHDKQTIQTLRDALTALTRGAQFASIHDEEALKPAAAPTPMESEPVPMVLDDHQLDPEGIEHKAYGAEYQPKLEHPDTYLHGYAEPLTPAS